MDLHQYPLLLSGSLDCKIEALLVDVEPSITPIQSRLGCPQDEMELHHSHLPPSSANLDPVESSRSMTAAKRRWARRIRTRAGAQLGGTPSLRSGRPFSFARRRGRRAQEDGTNLWWLGLGVTTHLGPVLLCTKYSRYTWNPLDLCFDRKRHEKTIFWIVDS